MVGLFKCQHYFNKICYESEEDANERHLLFQQQYMYKFVTLEVTVGSELFSVAQFPWILQYLATNCHYNELRVKMLTQCLMFL